MKTRFIISFLFLSTLAYGQAKIEFTREKTYDPLTLSKPALSKLVKSLQYYHNQNDPDNPSIYRIHSISFQLGTGNDSQTLNGFDNIANVEFEGRRFTELLIVYIYENQSISAINISLNDRYRKLTIKGYDQQRVNALFREIDELLTTNENFLGSVNWASILSITLYGLFVLSIIISVNIKPNVDNIETRRKARGIKAFCMIFAATCIIFFLLPFELRDLFPGFVLTEENTHWWDKYGNFIGVFSVLGSIALFVFKYVVKLFSIQIPAVSGSVPIAEVEALPSENTTDDQL